MLDVTFIIGGGIRLSPDGGEIDGLLVIAHLDLGNRPARGGFIRGNSLVESIGGPLSIGVRCRAHNRMRVQAYYGISFLKKLRRSFSKAERVSLRSKIAPICP